MPGRHSWSFPGSDLLWAVRGWLWGDAGREDAEQAAPQEQASAPAECLQVSTQCSLAKCSEWDCRLKANASEQRGANSGRLKLHRGVTNCPHWARDLVLALSPSSFLCSHTEVSRWAVSADRFSQVLQGTLSATCLKLGPLVGSANLIKLSQTCLRAAVTALVQTHI